MCCPACQRAHAVHAAERCLLQRRRAALPFPLLLRGTPSILSTLPSHRDFVILVGVKYLWDFYFGRFGKNSLTASEVLARRGGRQDREPLQLCSSNSLEKRAKNELHWKMDPKELDSVPPPFVCLPGFVSSLLLNLDCKVHGARIVFLLSVFSITAITKVVTDGNTQDSTRVILYGNYFSWNCFKSPSTWSQWTQTSVWLKVLQAAPWPLPQLLFHPHPDIFFCRCDLLALSIPGLHPKSVVMEIWSSGPGGECASLSHPSDKSWATLHPRSAVPSKICLPHSSSRLPAPPGHHVENVTQGN